MKVIIDIPENLYNFVNTKRPNGCYNRFDEFDCCDISKCIRNGIVLPKGHGRLIDAYDMKDIEFINKGNYNSTRTIREWIDSAPTIIEADKGE